MPEARSKITKKTAVKVVATKSAPKKKTKATSTPKKPAIVVKKAPTKRKPTVRKSIKAVTKPKKVTKKAPIKKILKESSKKNLKTTKEKARKDVVVLPPRMSIRAREKALVLAEHFEKKLHKPVYALSMSFGALFILFGSYSGLYSSDLFDNCSGSKCSAELISGLTDPLTTESNESVPEVELITPIPAELNSSYEVFVDTIHTQRILAELKFTGTGGSLEKESLSTTNRLNGRFSIVIPADELDSNQYTLQVKAYDFFGESAGYTTLGSFEIVNQESQSPFTPTNVAPESDPFIFSDLSTEPEPLVFPESVITPEPTDTVSLIQQPNQLDQVDFGLGTESVKETKPLITSSTNNTAQGDLSTEEDSVDDFVSESNEEVVQEEEDVIEPPLDTTFIPTVLENEIIIQAESVLSGAAPINIESTKFQFVSIYLRRLQSTEEQLVKTISAKETTYQLNTADFPNGMYELTVRTTSSFDDTVSNSLEITIANEVESLVDTGSATTPFVEEVRPVFQIQREVQQTNIETTSNSEELLTNEEAKTSTDQDPENIADKQNTIDTELNEPIKQRALARLEADTHTLDELFTRYAVAVQSGNSDMLREAQESIDTYQRSVVDSALASREDRFIADDLSKSLDIEIQKITTRVETFENLRRERSEGEVSVDTDGDGISDIDERLLFDTDPLRADTDGDGFTDGAEIIRGFNPVNAASEAVIVYESPKETIGISFNADLQVLDVTPDIVLPNVVDEEASIQATIRGRALPNSFVTLYVFSTPTVVTVKTESDGSFEYTFNKELEDGEHQVFVALTDNTGDIVAQSEPFTFIKQAEAFTAVDAQAVISQGETAGVVPRGVSSYQTVLSMSVLALGITLVLLGTGLRSNRPKKFEIKTQS